MNHTSYAEDTYKSYKATPDITNIQEPVKLVLTKLEEVGRFLADQANAVDLGSQLWWSYVVPNAMVVVVTLGLACGLGFVGWRAYQEYRKRMALELPKNSYRSNNADNAMALCFGCSVVGILVGVIGFVHVSFVLRAIAAPHVVMLQEIAKFL